MKPKIGIQGIKGSFHDQVVKEYYPRQVHLMEYLSFDTLAQAVNSGTCDQAVMALENSIAGSILPNYALLDHYELVITGEHFLNIEHNLMALPGQKIEQIREIHSHPMALLQCKKFFRNYPNIKLVESNDTAEEALKIRKKKIKARGAIAGDKAAKIYGLEILCSSIQTIKKNVTRFVIVQKNKAEKSNEISKAAWKFILDHKRGSLATALNVVSDCNLNLTKIQSLPIIETPGKYAFFVDVTFENPKDYFRAKALLEVMATAFKVLGEYRCGK